MKIIIRFLLIIIFPAVLLNSCSKKPEACIRYNEEFAEVAKQTNIESCSKGGESFTWRFGDGTILESEHAYRHFQKTGDFTVELVAYSKHYKHQSKASSQIKVRERRLSKLKILGVSEGDIKNKKLYVKISGDNQHGQKVEKEYLLENYWFPEEINISDANIRASKNNPKIEIYGYDDDGNKIIVLMGNPAVKDAPKSPAILKLTFSEIEFHYVMDK
jgi:hypothetical protein